MTSEEKLALSSIAGNLLSSEHRETIPPGEWSHTRSRLLSSGRWWVGHHSVTSIGGRPRRYCDGGVSTQIADRSYQGLWEGELRNPYLLACDPELRQGRHWGAPDEAALAEISGIELPHFFRRPPELPLVSIDLNAAYLSIFRNFSTRVEYRPRSGTWGAVGEPFQDLEELRKLKVLYSTIWSNAWRRKHAVYYFEGQQIEHPRISPTYQPQAARLLSDYFMAIAQEVISTFDAVGALCDAFIVREEQADDLLGFLQGRWGLGAKIERRWEPGEEWPWPSMKHPQGKIRELPDLVRARLAWRISGEKMSTLPAFVMVGDTWHEPEPEIEPEPEPWQKAIDLRPFAILVARPLPSRVTRRTRADRKPKEPGLRLGVRRIMEPLTDADCQWVEIERGPPDFDALRRQLRSSHAR